MFRCRLGQCARHNFSGDRLDDGLDFNNQNLRTRRGLRHLEKAAPYRECEGKWNSSQVATNISAEKTWRHTRQIFRKRAEFIGPIEGIMARFQMIPANIREVSINGKKTNNRF